MSASVMGRVDPGPPTEPAPQAEPRAHRRYGGSATTEVGRYVWYPVEIPALATPSVHSLQDRSILVLGGSAADRDRVAIALRGAGAAVNVLNTDQLEQSFPQDASQGIDAIRSVVTAAVTAAGRLDGIVDLGVRHEFELHRHEIWRSALVRTTLVLQSVYDDWAAETDVTRCFYLAVTWLGGKLGYDRQQVSQPLGGIWAGLAKSLPHELPACRVKVLDLAAADAADLGTLVAREASQFDYYEVGYRAGRRYTLAGRAAPCPPARLRLDTDDVILISGGGRGVGFAFAAELAAETGCRVVVTGRSPLPEPGGWVSLDDDAFAELCRQRLREAAPAQVGAIRRDNQRRTAMRGLARNIADATAAGLRIEYRACDFLDARAVMELVQECGERLRVVVHNAGIAAPTRLRGKAPETVLQVVESKLVTFTNLVAALRGRSIDYFCNVGSVAGRMGGMAGQIDYAAANEVLTRLGFWAQEQLNLPVATICWTTWEQIGLIANYEAALRYGSALRVGEGVQHWLRELLAAEPTETMFLGRVGTALAPTQIRGFLKFADHPDLPWLLSRQHYLGDVEQFAAFRSVRSRSQLTPGRHPCLDDFSVDGVPALPVSVALEYAISVGDWVAPPGWPVLYLRELRAVDIDLDALQLPEAGYTLTKVGTGSQVGDEWIVHSRLTDGHGTEVLRCDLVYCGEPAVPPSAVAVPEPPAAAFPGATVGPETFASTLVWHGRVYPRAYFCGDSNQVGAPLTPAHQADAWALPATPQTVLPAAAVEAVVQGMVQTGGPAGRYRRLHVERVCLTPTGLPEAGAVGTPGTGEWLVVDQAGTPILSWSGAGLT